MDVSIVDLAVVHCSATKPSMDIGRDWIDREHRNRKPTPFRMIGYHHVIRRSGYMEIGRPLNRQGAHARGYNHRSWAVCMVGGIAENGKAEDNFTDEQFNTLEMVLSLYRFKSPKIKILGHRDLSPDLNGDGIITPEEYMKECPCFTVSQWLTSRGFS